MIYQGQDSKYDIHSYPLLILHTPTDETLPLYTKNQLKNVAIKLKCRLDVADRAHINIDRSLYINLKQILILSGFIEFKMTHFSQYLRMPAIFHKTNFDKQQSKPKICTESWDIGKNVSKNPKISCLLPNISGPNAYFSKPIFVLNPWVQAGTMNPIIRRIFLGLIKGS